MHWLNRDYIDGSLSDAEADARLAAWRDARSSLSRRETGVISELTDAVYLGDAIVEAFSRKGQDAVEMILIAGDLQRGYERLWLQYSDADVIDDEEDTAAEWLRPGAEVIADELHVLAPESYEHSFILAEPGAFSIRFRRVELTATVVSPAARDRLVSIHRRD